MTGFNGGLGFAVINPADVANSLNFWDKPVLDGLFGGAITCGNVVGVMYLKLQKISRNESNLLIN